MVTDEQLKLVDEAMRLSSPPVVAALARRPDRSRLPADIARWLDLAELVGPDGPKAMFGPYRGPIDGSIMLANQSAITGTAEVGLFSVAQYSGFGPNSMRAGQKWQLNAWGIITTPGSGQGNITITPRFGTSTAGISIGASAATALVASATNLPWRLRFDLTIRSIGNTGNNSNLVGSGYFIAGTGVVAQNVMFCSTASVAFDASISGGIFIGITMGHASDSITTMDATVESVN
jgi:hypothetical protein